MGTSGGKDIMVEMSAQEVGVEATNAFTCDGESV